MKRKLAIYANGWNDDALEQALVGIRRYAKKEDFDIFVFLSFASYSEHVSLSQGELNIYKLCNPEDYDGIIVCSTMLNSNDTAVELCKAAKKKKVPVVSIGMQIEGIPTVSVSNEEGMRELAVHLVEEHGVKRAVFIGGTPDHVDSIARLRILREVMEEHGLRLEEKDVLYGEWGNEKPKLLVNQMINRGEELPDAIVCANDVMALAAATEFLEAGYSLPEDIIITGYDHIGFGQYFLPALSSVSQNFEEVGQKCCEIIFDQIHGREITEHVIVPSKFVPGESCGCTHLEEYQKIRDQYCQQSYQRHLDNSLLEQNERVLRQRISDIPSYASLKIGLRNHYEKNHQFEGSGFYMVLNSEYFEDPMMNEAELWRKGFRDRMEVVVALRNEEILPVDWVTRKELIPGYEKKQGEQHVYYMCPLHFFQYNYGYVVLVDDPYIMQVKMLYPYMEKLQQSLKFLRINLRLDALNQNLTNIYDKDPMTGLFNRFGYENKAIPLYQESLVRKNSMMVMFVDINYMKRINDQFGHLHGDNAIKTVAESIKANVKGNWIAVRFGGDEFLIIAPGCNEEEALRTKQAIMAFLEERNNDGSQPYRISASCGYVVTDPVNGRELGLQDYIKEADQLMYEIKQEVHARDGMPRK